MRFLLGSRRVVDPRDDEDGPDPFGDEVGDMPLSRRLAVQVGQRNAYLKDAAITGTVLDAPPVMLERFEILRILDSGGMGVVFEALDTALGRRVALKLCKAADVDDAAPDLEHEARCLAKLSHPNIVAVHEILRVGSDIVLVMELINGQTLHRWRVATKPSWRVVLDRFFELGPAIQAAHAVGIEHGDFKPNNAMIDHEGRARVIDFGLARYSIGPSVPNEAGEITVKGTAPYMPPERHMGKEPLTRPPGYPHADLFAFCVSLWESLYGVRPYAGETVPALLESIEAGKFEMGLVGATVVPDAVRDVLKRGLSARLSDRPQSMDELLRALSDACESASSRRARWRRRAVGGLVVVLAFASMVMAAMLMGAPEPITVERGAPALEPVAVPEPVAAPEPGTVALTLTLAVEAERAGHPDSALTYLELARKRAHADNDVVAQREVAEQAEALGDEFDLRGDRIRAELSWDMAGDIFFDLPDSSTAIKRLATKARNR